MSKFAEACKLSFEDWLLTMPNVEDLPEPQFSQRHIKRMNRLMDKMRGDKYHYFTRKTARALLVAAIIATLLLSAFVIPSSREFITENFDIFGIYKITEHNNNSVNSEITVDYLPEGYELVETDTFTKYVIYYYECPEKDSLYINKSSSSMELDFNTEQGYITKINIDNIVYSYSTNSANQNSILWTEKDYIYQVCGELPKEELLKIAQSVK